MEPLIVKVVDLIDSEEIYTFNRDYFHCIKKDKDKNIITEYTVDTNLQINIDKKREV